MENSFYFSICYAKLIIQTPFWGLPIFKNLTERLGESTRERFCRPVLAASWRPGQMDAGRTTSTFRSHGRGRGHPGLSFWRPRPVSCHSSVRLLSCPPLPLLAGLLRPHAVRRKYHVQERRVVPHKAASFTWAFQCGTGRPRETLINKPSESCFL